MSFRGRDLLGNNAAEAQIRSYAELGQGVLLQNDGMGCEQSSELSCNVIWTVGTYPIMSTGGQLNRTTSDPKESTGVRCGCSNYSSPASVGGSSGTIDVDFINWVYMRVEWRIHTLHNAFTGGLREAEVCRDWA